MLIAAGVCLLLGGAAAAQPAPQAATAQVSAQELVRRVIANEDKASKEHLRFLYRLRTEKPATGAITKELVETNEGEVARLIAVNDKAPTAQQRQADDERLQKLASDPQSRAAKRKQQKEDEERTTRMVKALPDAFLYEYDGFESRDGQQLVRLKFKPNPNYDPPNRELQVYQGMEGAMLVEPGDERLVKIEAHLFKGVNFGWGILGHLDPGGQFEVGQSRVGGDRWEVTEMRLKFTGKILLFKNLNITEHETAFDYRRAPDNLSFIQGIEFLKKQPDFLAEKQQR